MKRILAVVLVAALSGCVGFGKNSTRGVSTRTDAFKGITWVAPNMATAFGSGFYLYYGVESGKKLPLRVVFDSVKQSWVFPETAYVKIDGTMHRIDLTRYHRSSNVLNMGAGGVYVQETFDLPIGADYPDIAAAMCGTTGTIQVRVEGKDSFNDMDLPIYTETVREVCAMYAAEKI